MAFSNPYTKATASFLDAPSWACVTGESNAPTFTAGSSGVGSFSYGAGAGAAAITGSPVYVTSGSSPVVTWPNLRAVATPGGTPNYTITVYLAAGLPGDSFGSLSNGIAFGWESKCVSQGMGGGIYGGLSLEFTADGQVKLLQGQNVLVSSGFVNQTQRWQKFTITVNGPAVSVSAVDATTGAGNLNLTATYSGGYQGIKPILSTRLNSTLNGGAVYLTQLAVTYRA
jgi:hypothetical protein